ncbi:MAG: glutamate--tRNA ligase [Deltaproteobacteria bacterium]|nr:glutamate--tRNA ligase [Deltaproteobacteria bacterium]
MTPIRVRFAPSPTGVLHLGGARTALFNYLLARHEGGRFLLRIEDTDKERSTDESTRAIIDDLTWLGMSWDEEPVFQSKRIERHRAALDRLVSDRRVYKCYCTPEEREEARKRAEAEKRTYLYDGRCDGLPDRPGAPFVWRFRMPKEGETVVDDLVQGQVVTPNAEIEDLVIARSDGSPLYNFVVVVDDADMGITHVIRGKDHLTNTPKQIQIYRALGLPEPRFGHLPLILGLSKRLRSAGISSYKEQGYLPEAVNNYIARLGWSHGDEEVFTHDDLVAKFRIEDVNRSEGALNLEKMEWLNQQHLQMSPPEKLASLVAPFLSAAGVAVDSAHPRLAPACETRRQKARSLVELATEIRFYFVPDEAIAIASDVAAKHLAGEAKARLLGLAGALEAVGTWETAAVEAATNRFCEAKGLKLKEIAQSARVAFTGSATGPGLFETMIVLGKRSTLARLKRAAGSSAP